MSDRAEVTVHAVAPETSRLVRLTLDAAPEVLARYTRPGQIIIVHPEPDAQLYLAIASPVGAERLEVLLGPGAQKQLDPRPGQRLSISGPTGKGFPLEMAEGKDVLLFAVGSALAPVRPLIDHFRANRSRYGRVLLYVGAHTEADFPFAADFDAWRRDRIDIVRSISKPWVQDRFVADRPGVEQAVAFVCGMKEMMTDVERVLVAAGLPADRIGRNW